MFSATAAAVAIVVVAAAVIRVVAAAEATAAKQKNKDDDNPKATHVVSAEHIVSLSPRTRIFANSLDPARWVDDALHSAVVEPSVKHPTV